MTDLVAKRLPDLHRFDPADVELLMVQDVIGEQYNCWPGVARYDVRQLSTNDLAEFRFALRQAIKLPLSERFIQGITAILDYATVVAHEKAMEEARREARIRKAKADGRYQDWEQADLRAEVESVCGAGVQRGRQWWFRCQWHQDDTPSLEVDAERKLFHCFGCGRSGGVVEWRRATRMSTDATGARKESHRSASSPRS